MRIALCLFFLSSFYTSLAQQPQLIVPIGDTGTFSSGIFSSEGKKIFTLSDQNTITIWDLGEGSVRSIKVPGAAITSLANASDDQYLLTGSRDGMARLIDLNGNEIQAFKAHEQAITAVTFAPDGKTLLTGSKDGNARLWDQEGHAIRTLRGLASDFFPLAVSPDGQTILTGSFDGTAKLWNLQGWELQSFQGHKSSVTSVAFAPDGRTLLTGSADGTARLWDFRGNPLQVFSGHTAKINSVAFSPDGRYILTGSDDYSARLWKMDGTVMQTMQGHTSFITSAVFSPDGLFILTNGQDNRGILWSVSGTEVATLANVPPDEWIITAPSGLFDASINASNLMHYSIFYEAQQEYLIVGLEQFKARYWEPGLMPRAMGLSGGSLRDLPAFTTLPLYPKIQTNIDQNILQIELTERNGGIGQVSIFLNTKELAADINPDRKKQIQFDLGEIERYFRNGENRLSLRAYNAEGWLTGPPFEILIEVGDDEDTAPSSDLPLFQDKKNTNPQLFVISIGTSDHKGERLDQYFSDQDAADIAKSFAAIGAPLFGEDHLNIYCLTTDSSGLAETSIQWQMAGKENIKTVFEQVEQEATANDIILVFLSGHGFSYQTPDREEFYYLTKDIGDEEDFGDPVLLQNYAISESELANWLTAIPAYQQALILDLSESPQILRTLDRLRDQTGMFILTGSEPGKASYEASHYGRGLLAYALLEGMSGRASRSTASGERIGIMSLFQYTRERVPVLATAINAVQLPMLAFPTGGESFDIGILDEKAVGILAGEVLRSGSAPNHLFGPSFFLKEDDFTDKLQLARQLNQQLLRRSESDTEISYVNKPDMPGVYSVRGIYRMEGEMIHVRAKLVKDDRPGIVLDVQPSDDPRRLVRYIYRAIGKHLETSTSPNNPR